MNNPKRKMRRFKNYQDQEDRNHSKLNLDDIIQNNDFDRLDNPSFSKPKKVAPKIEKDETYEKIIEENRRLWKQVEKMKKDQNTNKSKRRTESKSPFMEEEEVKLEERLKELEKIQNNPKYNSRHENSLINVGVFRSDKKVSGLEINKTISDSKVTSSSKDLEIELLRQQLTLLRDELKKANDRIIELENQFDNEDEINKMLNSSFGGSDHKSLSFYGVQTRGAKSPVLPRNVTYIKGPQKQFDMSEHSDKVHESLRYYKYKTRTLQKGSDIMKVKYQKINKRTKELYSLNEKLISALKAQKSFEQISGDKKKITCKNCGEKISVVVSNFSSSMDKINIKAENASFLFCSNGLGHYSPTMEVSPRFNNKEEFIYSPKQQSKPKMGKDTIEFRTKVVNNDGKYVKKPKKKRNRENRSRTGEDFARNY